MSFFFQGSWGGNGHKNFEVVIPFGDDGLAHYWRDNDHPELAWHGPVPFGAGKVRGVTAIESSFGPGNFEVVVVRDDRLESYFRGGSPLAWHGPFGIPLPRFVRADGGPSMIQGRSGHDPHRNFELVVPNGNQGVLHLWRDNETIQWRQPTDFGLDRHHDGAALVRKPGVSVYEEILALLCDGGALWLTDRPAQGGSWSTPEIVPGSSGVHGTPGMVRTDFRNNVDIAVPAAKGGLAHFWLDEDGWHRFDFGQGDYSAASIIQSSFIGGAHEGRYNGNLEVVAIPRGRRGFDHYWRDNGTWEWRGPVVVA